MPEWLQLVADATFWRAEIVHWVAEDLQPYSIVGDHGFQSLMKTGRPTYYIPSVDLGCWCISYCLMWHFFSDYFSCFLSRLIWWFVAFVLHCFSLFGLFVVLKFSSPVSLLFSLWHWAQECSLVDYLNTFSNDSLVWHQSHVHTDVIMNC